MDAMETSLQDEESERDIACSIIMDRASGSVFGVQLAGRAASYYAEAASLISSLNINVRDLAYLESPCLPGSSSGGSPINLTAHRAVEMGRR